MGAGKWSRSRSWNAIENNNNAANKRGATAMGWLSENT